MNDHSTLDAAIARLAAFRRNLDPADQISRDSGLTAEDLDQILARLEETRGATPVSEMKIGEEARAEPDPRWFGNAGSLSDVDVVGEHGAMQDGVHDDRKDALAAEIDRRKIDQ